MDCEDIKKIIPRYYQHIASEEEITQVEEHLCVCHDCRAVLGELMDNPPNSAADPSLSDNSFDQANESLEQPQAVSEHGTPTDSVKDNPTLPEANGEANVYSLPEEGKIEYFPGESIEDLMKAPVGNIGDDGLKDNQRSSKEDLKAQDKLDGEDIILEKEQYKRFVGEEDFKDNGTQRLSAGNILPEDEAVDLNVDDKIETGEELTLNNEEPNKEVEDEAVDLNTDDKLKTGEELTLNNEEPGKEVEDEAADLSRDTSQDGIQSTDLNLEKSELGSQFQEKLNEELSESDKQASSPNSIGDESLSANKEQNEYSLVEDNFNSAIGESGNDVLASGGFSVDESVKTTFLNYIVLIVGLLVFGFLIFLLLRG